MAARALFYALLILVFFPPVSHAFTIVGFGNSITCATCNDGSYLGLLNDHLDPDAVLIDEGQSADVSENLFLRLDLWLDSNSADLVIILTGTPDAYKAVGGFQNQLYEEQFTIDNVDAMIDIVHAENTSVLLVAPPPVQSPCNDPINLTCATIDARLASLATAMGALAVEKGVSFVDLYDIFINDPRFSEPFTSEDSLFRNDGLHPKYPTGDDLIASRIAQVLLSDMVVPEPSTGLLLALGLAALTVDRKRAQRAR